jgi:hypothetical protein
MTLFADVAARSDASTIILREARDIPKVSADRPDTSLGALIQRHAAEWRRLLESLPDDAWLSRNFLR